MKRLLLGSFVAAVILMVWGFLFWAVNPLAKSVLLVVDNEDAVIDVLNNAIDKDGTYFVPMAGMDDGAQMDAWTAKHKRGPLARISFHKAGADPLNPMLYVMGFIHAFLSAFIMGMIVLKVAPVLPSMRKRWDFIILIACFAVLFIDWSDPIWLYGPASYAWFLTAYHILGWMLAGGALAAMLKGEKEEKG